MAEYIEREALLAELQEEIDFETTMYTAEQLEYFNKGLKCAYKDAKRQPAADVVEVRHGKWINDGEDWFCNRCNHNALCDKMTGLQVSSVICPNCGAKMDGKGEGE